MPFTKSQRGSYYRNARFLTADEELRLFEKWRNEGDSDAHSLLCESIMPFAQKQAINFCKYRRWNDTNAAISAAYLGVLIAVRRFEPSKKCRLSTYAGWWIRQCLQKEIHESRIIHIPLYLTTGKEKVDPESLPTACGDYMHDDYRSIEDDSFSRVDAAELELKQRAMLCYALGKITERRRAVLVHRFFLGLTLKETGEIFGLTRERIRQIEMGALEEIRVWAAWFKPTDDMDCDLQALIDAVAVPVKGAA